MVGWAWPTAHLFATLAEIDSFTRFAEVTLANSILVVAGYLAVAALFWGFADALMPQPITLREFATRTKKRRVWRVAHLSDIHIVGERYGFRLESGRVGPRGNVRLKRLLAELDAIHAKTPVDVVLISGDVTDAGIAGEWAEFFDMIAPYPHLVQRMLILPGNHDLNIVDRSNPARMDLPGSPNIRLRQLRMLSAMDAVQGKRVKIIDRKTRKLGKSSRRDARAASRRLSRVSPTRAGHSSRDGSPSCGPGSSPWCCRRMKTMGSGSSCSTPMPIRISPSPTRSA